MRGTFLSTIIIAFSMLMMGCPDKETATTKSVFSPTANIEGFVVGAQYPTEIRVTLEDLSGNSPKLEANFVIKAQTSVAGQDGARLLGCGGSMSLPPMSSWGESIDLGSIGCDQNHELRLLAQPLRAFATPYDRGYIAGLQISATLVDSLGRPLGGFPTIEVQSKDLKPSIADAPTPDAGYAKQIPAE